MEKAQLEAVTFAIQFDYRHAPESFTAGCAANVGSGAPGSLVGRVFVLRRQGVHAVVAGDEALSRRPRAALVDILSIPETFVSPGRRILRRLVYALGALAAVTGIVYLDRGGYTDSADGEVSFLDCVYYATVSLSTTGYGDIAPVTPTARFINVVAVTPLRVVFLIILIGTTVETLTNQSRRVLKIQRWRHRVRDHTVVVGYGTKGRAAVAAMVGDEVVPADIVVIDENSSALERARGAGLVTVHGDATNADLLRIAGAQHAKAIIVATDDDATAVLVTLTARQIAPKAKIIAAARETENQHLLRQSGADSTVVSAVTAGRLLGVAIRTPSVVEMIEDLLTPDRGFAISERDAAENEVGCSPRDIDDIVLGVVRAGQLIRVDAPEVGALQAGDRLLLIRNNGDFR